MEFFLDGHEHFDGSGYSLSVRVAYSPNEISQVNNYKREIDKRGISDLSFTLQIIDFWSNDFILNFELWGIFKSACSYTRGWQGSWKISACVLVKVRTP